MKKLYPEPGKSITGHMLKPLADAQKESAKRNPSVPSVSTAPIEPAAEYQDDGGGYNPSLIVPQR